MLGCDGNVLNSRLSCLGQSYHLRQFIPIDSACTSFERLTSRDNQETGTRLTLMAPSVYTSMVSHLQGQPCLGVRNLRDFSAHMGHTHGSVKLTFLLDE
ncbi:unnamed protein product [Protopolystoma xenopodis]|uniref:Uncharacterized protein n=1 Tax=Protopolystoma xenopodis TaxID=117903 RepID=A0A448XRN5_9PLAT|nr:unnamed protein product [Protopolystoma xenopodis]